MEVWDAESLSLVGADDPDLRRHLSAHKQKIDRLIEKNGRLAADVAVLKRQFDSAVELSSNLENTFAGHSATVKELERVKLERDDLATRLTILGRTNSELASQLREIASAPPASPAHEKRVKRLEGELAARDAQLSAQTEETQTLCRTLSAFFGTALASVAEVLAFVGARKSYASAVALSQRQSDQICVLEAKLKERTDEVQRQSDQIRVLEAQQTERTDELQRQSNQIRILETQLKEQADEMQRQSDQIHALEARERTNEKRRQSEQRRTMEAKARDRESKRVRLLEAQLSDPAPESHSQTAESIGSPPVSSASEDASASSHDGDQSETVQGLRRERERDRLMRLVSRQNRLSNPLAAKVRTAETEIANLTKKLRTAQAKLRKATTFESAVQSVPESVWKCPEFPEDLALLIDDVVGNGNLQLGTKIRRALSIVCNYFASSQEGLESEVKREREAVEEMVEHLRELFPPDLNITGVLKNDGAWSRIKDFMDDGREETAKLRELVETQNRESAEKAAELEKEQIKQKTPEKADQTTQTSLEREKEQTAQKTPERADQTTQTSLEREKEQNVQKADQTTQTIQQFDEQKAKLEAEVRDLAQCLAEETEMVRHIREAEAQQKMVIQKKHVQALHVAEDQHRQEIKAKTAEMRKLKRRDLKTVQVADEKHRQEVEGKALKIRELAHKLEVEVQAKAALMSEIGQAKGVIKRLRSCKAQLELGLASAGHENEENRKQISETLKIAKSALRARIVELVERLRVQSGDFAAAEQSSVEKINALETQIAELKAQGIEAGLQKRKLETRITGILAECDREKKAIQATLNAHIRALEVESNKKQDEYQLSLSSLKGSMCEIANAKLARFVEGVQRIDEQNSEWCLDIVKKRLENSHRQEMRIRTLMALTPYDSIEDAISMTVARKS
jgi:colicin import membrane protein